MDATPAPPACIAEASDILRIQADGAICYQGQLLTLADLKNRLEVEKAAGVESTFRVMTASEEQDIKLQYGQLKLMDLLDLLRQMDRVKVGLVTVTGKTR
jgi:biopolymer transport protein ExbD